MNNVSIKKSLVLIMTLVLVLSSFGASFAADTFNDLNKAAWAAPTIEKWASYDLISGYPDGSFRPTNSITRAEFAVIAYKAFNLESSFGLTFSDINKSDWFYNEVSKLAKLGFIKGYADGTFKPYAAITRAEAASMLANIEALTGNIEGAKVFTDYESFPTWASANIGASVVAKYITGYEDATFRASNTITRAETVAMLNNAVYTENKFANNWRIVTAGTYGGTTEKPVVVKGNVYIKTPGVELKNLIIEGDLIFGVEIGEGDATIDGVVVKGETSVYGGGINSIYIKNSDITKLIVIKENDTIRIVAQGSTTVDLVLASSGVKLQEIDLTTGKGFTEVNIDEFAGMEVIFIGLFDEITIDSPNVEVVIPAGTTVKSLVLDQPVDVTGAGTVITAVVSVEGITFEKAPTNIEVDSTKDITVEIAGKDVEFDAGSTTPTTPPVGGTTPPVTPPVPPTPVKTMYNFLVWKWDVITHSLDQQLVASKLYYATDKLNFQMVEDVYEGFDSVPTYAVNTIKDILLLKSENNHYYAERLANKLSTTVLALKVFDENNVKTALNAVVTAISDNDISDADVAKINTLAGIILTYDLSDMLDDLELLYPTENIPSSISFFFINASGQLVQNSGDIKISELYDFVNTKLGNFTIDSVAGNEVIGVKVNNTMLTIVIFK